MFALLLAMVNAVNFRRLLSVTGALGSLSFVVVGCGDDGSSSSSSSSGTGTNNPDGGPPICAPGPAPQKPAASCEVTIESPPIPKTINHVPVGTNLQYCGSPPSSGDHFPQWAAFAEYDKEIEFGYLVHDLEHGAIVLLYKCDAGQPCPDIVNALREAKNRAAVDPLCNGQGTDKRIIIAPSSKIPTKVAAAAWGKTYTAACVDGPTLDAFIRDNYAKGPENFCFAGQAF
jgi:hypothetical protein